MYTILILSNRRYGASKTYRAKSQIHSSFDQGSHAKPALPKGSHRWKGKPYCDASSQPEKLETQCLCPLGSGRQREEEGRGRWHPARLGGSLGPIDLAILPAPERCKPGSQPHQKLAAGRLELPNTSTGAGFPGLGFTQHTGTGHC